MRFISTLLLALAGVSSFVAAAEDDGVKVDRLVSRSVGLEKRDKGFRKGHGQKGNYELSFYHVNDVHAHLDEFRSSGSACTDPTKGCVGGYSRIKTVIDKKRKTKKNSLFLNAGDEFQGTLFYTVFKGEKIALTLNQLGFDAMTLGNHEFDDGDDLLADFLSKLKFPTISSNIHTTHKKLKKQLLPYKIWKKHSLAVVAVTTETTKGISKPGNGTEFEDPVTAVQRTVDQIKKHHRNVKRIVALTHIGFDKDVELAKKTRGFNLIIGGHSHTLLGDSTNSASAGSYPTIATNLDKEEVFIVTSYRWGEYVGYIDLEYDRHGRIVGYEGAPIRLTNATTQDTRLQKQVDTWAGEFKEFANRVIGTTTTFLDQSTCQKQECTLGDFSADSMADYRPLADGALLNAGGIRASIDVGDITVQDALTVFPFGNSNVELTFTGKELWSIFEGIFSATSQSNGRPVTSGVQVSRSIRITHNPKNPAGQRLISLNIGGEPVQLEKVYTIVTLDFLASGGDNFWERRSDAVLLNTMDEVWMDYVTEKTPISVELDGRISVTEETVPQKGI